MAKNVKPASRGSEQFVLRLPDGMRGKLAKLAKKNGRSMNSELIDRLQKSIAADDDTKTLSARVTDLTFAIMRLFPNSADVTREAEKLKQDRPDSFDSSLMKLKPKGQHDDG